VGPRASMDKCGKSRLHRDLIPEMCSPQPVGITTTLPGPHHNVEIIVKFMLQAFLTLQTKDLDPVLWGQGMSEIFHTRKVKVIL
jgi:hypothetical protein